MARHLSCWVFVCAALACESGEEAGDEPQNVVDTKPIKQELPPLELRDETPDLLLTWIDDEGDFHVVQKPSEVPAEAREKVRVVVATTHDGTGQLVYVADLRNKKPDGAYAVGTMTRAAWNELGASRRQVRLDAVLPKEPEETQNAEPLPAGELEATIYGADWCKPCHDAEKFLKSLGVKVTKKDIEKSRAARSEMQQKLAKIGKPGASIPVIDLMGKVFVGFNRSVLRRLVENRSKTETL